ncbi:aminotransferase class V-fold PLP-dependent enzyme [Microbacterium sp. SLBN-146]|uniref:aminotransferase class V-fold PLP-dependent enzyme n=1 Tax=Microbacterium sp. SLBN-146 TaxID=2768457 RepID=UPI00114EF3AB|nr:aminotransferase class V-fold PLP-dependent enzyme [Microbacterium sp. SLBN-146]
MSTLLFDDTISTARAAFDGGRGYLAACTVGLPPRSTRDAIVEDVTRAAAGEIDPVAYSAIVERSRSLFAALVGVPPDRIAVGSQVSVFTALIAGAVPDGGEILVPDGDFSSIARPLLHAGRGLRVRSVPLALLADAVGPDTACVAFSLVQSATGDVADVEAITRAARRHGAVTYCDATQAVGWMPVDATRVDALVCHAYKWLCAPRGVAFLAVSAELQTRLRPIHAAWYAGEDPWQSCYGSSFALASDARRFDVSPAWQAFVGAAPALALFAGLDAARVHAHTTHLATLFRTRMGLARPAIDSAIVTWDDPGAADLAALTASGIRASGRSGRARVAFHVFNDERDVDDALRALGR